ncbi:MAG: hypothetical protein V4690_00510 [Patescibacteria group bacterium]
MSTKLVVGLVIGIAVLLMGFLYFTSDSYDNEVENNVATTTPVDNTPVTGQPSVPVVVTSASVSASDNAVMVNGTVNPRGAFTTYWYEYGFTTALGSKTNNQTIGSGFSSIQAPI